MSVHAKQPRLSLRGITKQYPGCLANDDIHLDIDAGEIHALLGENGAGKSTLMKVIYGLVKPDQGEVFWNGESVTIKDPAHARQMGIGMVFQHFSLFDTLTVTENIALALGKKTAGDLSALAEKITSISKKYGMEIQPNRQVHSLSVGERQRVEIVRCLVQDIKLLILDEPTSVLTPQEVESLFVTLRKLAQEGCSILFISHKLHEVKALCQKATVLRGGRVSGSCDTEHEDASSLAKMMVGDDTPISAAFTKKLGTKKVLEVAKLNQTSDAAFGIDLKNIDFSVHAGEIVGIAGVAGNGQEELLASLSGETLTANNTVSFNRIDVSKLTPEKRRALGLGFVPEERLGRGAVPSMSLTKNALLTGFLTGIVKKGMISWHKTQAFAEKIISEYSVKASGQHAEAKSLSGGNLQKFIIGREILQNPKILIASHPTWGVDIGAATAIHNALIRLRDQGAAIVVISEDIDELFLISDRIGAICDGQLSKLVPTEQTTIEILGRQMAGDLTAAAN
ncbi:ABC transporter ATP-binding protein [Reinekea thalattae]|uniref:ABC transporter ATP-binding protein n=1 Tax=Reinekea thalattae TaxID=2593301 RepID=A0A5C8Z436_9GAMM|nr:ABC transporter ATP-binding protein [Reinekea thalattae]TXR51958.1 ABC transporter ATP-binding protein [Reinekea thalattae]